MIGSRSANDRLCQNMCGHMQELESNQNMNSLLDSVHYSVHVRDNISLELGNTVLES